MRGVWSLAMVVAALVGGTVACGRSGYQYVQNDDLGIYAKLPGDWTVYDESDLFPDSSAREESARAERMWFRTFDAADAPSVEASQQPGADDPVGFVGVFALARDQRELLNLRALRGAGSPERDPVALAAAGPTAGGPTYQVLLDEPVEFEGGYSGVHTVFTSDEGGSVTVFDRTAVRDTATTAVAIFEVSCSETCYFETHKDEIADLVDSWTLQEVR